MFSHRKNRCENIHPPAAIYFCCLLLFDFGGRMLFRWFLQCENIHPQTSLESLEAPPPQQKKGPRAGVCFRIGFCGAKTYTRPSAQFWKKQKTWSPAGVSICFFFLKRQSSRSFEVQLTALQSTSLKFSWVTQPCTSPQCGKTCFTPCHLEAL